MKVGILAGGFGTRLAEETEVRPKPMVEIGGKPILWHIMKLYERYGHEDFVVALGYKGEYIKRYMVDYCSLSSDLTVRLGTGDVVAHGNGTAPSWNVGLIDTGLHTNTGGRIKRLQPHMNDETFMLTWGDGVSDIDLDKLLAFHKAHGKLITVTAVRPPGPLRRARDRRRRADHQASPRSPSSTRAGSTAPSSCCEPGVFDYIDGDATAVGEGAAGGARRRRSARGLQARGLLAVHGHAP